MKFDHIMNGEITGTNKLIRNLSAGNKQKVGIIGAMISYPQLLILDEPFNFLDPSSQLAMKKVQVEAVGTLRELDIERAVWRKGRKCEGTISTSVKPNAEKVFVIEQ